MKLIVPVYLNQKLVFDLVAMIEGGIATVTQVSNSSQRKETDTSDIKGSFGLSDAISSLMRINLSAGLQSGRETGDSKQTAEERVHTPSSLFYNLRNRLGEEKLIKSVSSDLCSGDFVEFEATLSKNPLVENLEAILQLLELTLGLLQPNTGKRNKSTLSDGSKELRMVKQQILAFSEIAVTEGSKDLVAKSIDDEFKALISLNEQYLNDLSMSDLIDGRFKVLGKVIRPVLADDDSINLLRKTPLVHTPDMLNNVLEAITTLQDGGINLPRIETQISGQVLQVLPIAIYS